MVRVRKRKTQNSFSQNHLSNVIVILEVATFGGAKLQQTINIEGFYVLHFETLFALMCF